MTDSFPVDDLANAIAYDSTGDKIGSINEIYLNERTGQPNFVAVNTSMSGLVDSIVPLRGHTLRDGELHLAFERDRIEDAPMLDTSGYLTTEEQDAFYRHYGVDAVQDLTTYTTSEHAELDDEHTVPNEDGIRLRRWQPQA